MLSRLGIRAKLTVLQTGVFFVAGCVVVTVIYFQNQVVIAPIQVRGGGQAHRSVPGTAEGVAIWRNDTLSTLLTQWIVALLAMTALTGLLTWWVTGRVLKPVRRMTAQARRISSANLHERIGVHGPHDEFKHLSDTFDDLLARLDNAFHAQGRFIANASHELRTPLAVARTTLQIGLAGTDPERVRRVRDDLLQNNDRCIALINGMLTLATCEQGLRERDTVALDAVVRQAVGEYAAADPGGGPRITLVAPDGCPVAGDGLLLGQLTRNLVENAVRYNVPGGQVLVEVGREGLLRVTNTGPVIEQSAVAALFEPFRRGVERTASPNGAGLGLSIVHAIVTAHDGTIHARAREGGGLVIEVTVPRVLSPALVAVG
ncbi:sensor histidine kinase [Amycolatopsis jiangsuensis]|uniref:histidine kinase n=1 Tax=Amycolatopsis jiangsuensis TaxID=1181879 RepID=A0A840IWR4_9PSEU|nr:HAMP domain-containing sensor histidine kinase [Amycolatopsis jiangsuensis]MBB4687211.1 signal transduction histidine kinase [Amycolatopsis jiangsuensis]